VGRALRRASYDVGEDGLFEAEYAEVYGVPFSFLSTAVRGTPRPPKPVLVVQGDAGSANLRNRVPRVVGLPLRDAGRASDGDVRRLFDPRALDSEVPTSTELDPSLAR